MSVLLKPRHAPLLLPHRHILPDPKPRLVHTADIIDMVEWHRANARQMPDWVLDEIEAVASLNAPLPGWIKDVFTFHGLGNTSYQALSVPAYVKAIAISVLGAGGGGGNGFTAAAAAARGGGGGGGGGAFTRCIITRDMMGDQIFLAMGLGGAAATAGQASYVGLRPSTAIPDLILVVLGGGLGGTGTGAAAGAAGAGGVVSAQSDGSLGPSCISFSALTGFAGSLGGAQTGAVGANVTLRGPTHGGCGGGGTTSADFSGGSYAASGRMPALAGGSAGSPNGLDGFGFDTPLFFYGGTGGAGINASVGGNGGNGAPGSGGGGGGGGTTGGSGGRGGNARAYVYFMG